MQRTPINPWPWSTKVGYNQAELLEGASRHLICAGQTAVDDHGRPMHPNDMRSQVALSMDNLEAVLQEAGMGLENVSGLRIYATDVESAMSHFDILGAKFGAVGQAPPMTLIGVTRLALPELMFEIEATAWD